MSVPSKVRQRIVAGLGLWLPVLVFSLLAFVPPSEGGGGLAEVAAQTGEGDFSLGVDPSVYAGSGLQAPGAACAGGPVIDGITLDECYIETFLVGGINKSIRVWYTKSAVTATRMVDGNPVVLSHWIDTDAQAQQVAAWGRQAWERYFAVFGHHPYDTGCSDRINVQMEDGVGWSGIAYWASSGSCNIGIDSPSVRGGGGQWTVYHEFQHYLQYSFDNGCYGFLQPNYMSGSAAGDAEFVEGYADLGADSVNATLDATGYGGAVSGDSPNMSMYDKSYGNVYNKYFMEQVGNMFNPADPWHHMDAILEHYTECDVQNTLYVLDTVIPAQLAGMTEEELYLNFFAANWAKDWADPATQPQLVYTDDDGNAYGAANLDQNVTIASGTQSWNGQSTPDDWAGRYYQVRPQSGCNYVTAEVDGAPGANLGINLMAAQTTGSPKVSRAAWIGEDFTRTFAGYGTFDRVVAAINGFATIHSYDVSFQCVTPALNILEPRQTNFALVGDPATPIAFLARFSVKDGSSPVRGLLQADFSATAEGDAITLLPNTLQEVGEEYWAVMVPPIKPGGTTFVDLTICLDGTICNTETDALLYVAPGNTDIAMVFDASGSMLTEDIIGEGTRLVNAKKAGTVMADLLRVGDRIRVSDFSAQDIPPGCGLPGGDGNCPLDIGVYQARTDVVGPGTIVATRAAINSVNAREWTPISAALVDAKNALQAAPYSLNPKHIVLLSDGEENVNPLYATVRTELIDSGVVINTIGFSGESPAALLAQIAADTGGIYRFVPTTGGTLATSAAELDTLAAQGVPKEFVERINTAVLPGPLGLDDVYDYLDTETQDAARLFHSAVPGAAAGAWQTVYQFVDGSVTRLRLVAASKQPDYGSCGTYRNVEVAPPGGIPGQPMWYPISPAIGGFTPASWDVRNSLYDDVVVIPNPAKGVWGFRVLMNDTGPCASAPQVASEAVYDLMLNGSAETDIQLDGRFLNLDHNQGTAGQVVPIVGSLLGSDGMIPGALVLALVEKPGGSNLLLLFDDGMHSDGGAGDGIYGWNYTQATVGGSYNVRMVAYWTDVGSGETNTREWLGTFWIEGPELNDGDHDGLPDDWESRCKLNTLLNDASGDLDQDGLSNGQEFARGTNPCDPDTDNGGERDGSEVNGNRNPLYAPDDGVSPLRHFSIDAFNGGVYIHWAKPFSYTHMLLYISTDPGQLGQPFDLGSSGTFSVTPLINNQTYYGRLAPANGNAAGAFSDPEAFTPQADPDPPSGAVLINNGAATTSSPNVVLNLTSTDEPLPGAAESANAHHGNPWWYSLNEVSGDVEMMVSNDPSFAGATWEPLASEKPWTLAAGPGGVLRVYVKFRDAALNESFVVFDDILLHSLYLPIMYR